MPSDLPYMPTYKNVGRVFELIGKAKIPDAFTVRYLANTLGLKGTGDRQLISLLKKLGFLDNAGKPTPAYGLLKNSGTAKAAIASGIRRAYAPLFEADEDAHAVPDEQLKGLVAQVSGADEAMTRQITGTLRALIRSADFTAPENTTEAPGDSAKQALQPVTNPPGSTGQPLPARFNPEFRFNVEIHLPSNGTEDTYLAIFNALRKALG
jgi:hypothetical protein